MGMIPALLAAGCRVVDLSADFRHRDVAVYESLVPRAYRCRNCSAEAVYGLPELFREQIPAARLVANPGCYPTSVALALAPLLEQSLIDPTTIIVDSKSGTSGAGRAAKVDYPLLRGQRGFQGLRPAAASAYPGDRADAQQAGRT